MKNKEKELLLYFLGITNYWDRMSIWSKTQRGNPEDETKLLKQKDSELMEIYNKLWREVHEKKEDAK